MYYEMTIAGCKRQLTLCKLNDELMIGAFVILGDQELTVACAKALLEISPDYDYLISAEAKGIPLAHEMARQHGDEKYIVARKGVKLYMSDVFKAEVRSITTDHQQTLYLDKADAELMKGKRILVVDDVVSTGESLYAVQELVKQAGGEIVGNVTILAEGRAADRTDIKYLERLPLFNAKGEPLA